MNRFSALSTVFALALVTAACANGPDPNSFGNRLQTQGGAIAGIGEKWSKGDATVSEGRALIKEGEADVEKGQARVTTGERKIRRGESLVRDGQRMKQQAEESYRNLDSDNRSSQR